MTTEQSPPLGADHHTSTLSSGAIVHTWRTADPRAITLLQHEFAEYAERYVDQYHQLIRRLKELRFEVRALDMWGHGRSPGIRSVADVEKAVQDHLEMRREIDERGLPIYLFGHSLGGLMTAGSVTADSSRIRGVILTGPALPAPPSMLGRWVVETGAKLMPATPIPVKREPTAGMSRLAEQQRLAEGDPLMFKGQISFLVAATALRTAQSMWQGLGKWHVPTLVMHGTDDRYTDLAQSERFIDCIKSPDKTLHLVSGGLHELLNDLDRGEMLQLILNWLSEHLERN